MSGFQADVARIDACGRTVGDLTDRVGTVREQANAAALPDIAWGLIGQPIAWIGYDRMVSDFTEFLGQLHKGVRKAGDHLSGCAADYRTAEDAAKVKLEEITRALDTIDIRKPRGA